MRAVRVLCLVPYPSLGASNRLRVEQYAGPLHELGIDLVVSPFLDSRGYDVLYRRGHTPQKAAAMARGLVRRLRDLTRVRAFDLVLVHREAGVIGSPFIERGLVLTGRPYLYDFDDAIFLEPPYAVNRAWNWLRPSSRISEIARRARLVVTQNEYLAEWARARNSDVVVIPTPVDTDRHRPRPQGGREGPFVIGWVGSPTTAPYLRLLDAVLSRIADRHPIVVRVIGGTYENPRVPIELLPYDLDAEPEQVAAFDIGLLPQPDDRWTRGKGAFKALLYMASAVPVVASRVGVNEQVIGEAAGYAVDTEAEWFRALDRLLTDPALRARMGDAGRKRVVERYSVRASAPRLADAIRRAVGTIAP